ncbi:MAG: hypothetical protein ACR2FU_15775 [Streptosporangiaceae bacterium]
MHRGRADHRTGRERADDQEHAEQRAGLTIGQRGEQRAQGSGADHDDDAVAAGQCAGPPGPAAGWPAAVIIAAVRPPPSGTLPRVLIVLTGRRPGP